MKIKLAVILCYLSVFRLSGIDCNWVKNEQSKRFSNYRIHCALDHSQHTITSQQEIHFKNHSNIPLDNLLFYIYLNAFQNDKSTFLKGVNDIFGRSFKDRKDDQWADMNFKSITINYKGKSTSLTHLIHYVQNDDNNSDDSSVMELCLPQLFLPGDTMIIKMEWEARMPKVIARAGYDQDFYLFCHWFPQLGVLEQNSVTQWHWNCHQFFRNTEFYGEFSDYDVWMKCDTSFKMCSSGEFVDEIQVGGQYVKHYHAKNVIDFAWAINKQSYIKEWKWNNIKVRIMLPYDYDDQEQRVRYTINSALDYMYKHLAYYPYYNLSVVCPPFHALRTGLMEYPSLITTGSIYGFPNCLKHMESLIVHEFVHQYFMATLANNEKEEPWMDEGFATYYEDRVIDAIYGEGYSMVDCFGVQMDNKQMTRMEYTGMKDHNRGIIARPAWTFEDFERKSLIYSKTATILHSLERMIGATVMDTIMKKYYDCYKFTHPRGIDFMNVLKENLHQLVDSTKAEQCYEFVRFGIFEKGSMDYSINEIKMGSARDSTYAYDIILNRNGNWICSTDISFEFSNQSKRILLWDAKESTVQFHIESNTPLVKAHLDSDQKLLTDLNLNNNTYSLSDKQHAASYYASKLAFWWQSIIHYFSLIV